MNAQQIETILGNFASFMWGPPLIVLLVGGGFFFLLYSRMTPYWHFPHALRVLRGDSDNPEDQGDITHFQALSTALSGTLGLGNVAGVAVAIGLGGPGAVFWMWLTAVVGVATKFITATLAVMYRGEDSLGKLQGGPMYVIREALGRRWMPLAWLFAFAALIGTTPVFQVNQLVQLVQLVRDVVAVPAGITGSDDHFLFDLIFGLVLAGLVAMLGPVIDTLIVCTCTALAIIVTDAWQIEGVDGITMTANAFQSAIPGAGE